MNPTEYDDIVVLKGQSATLRLNNPNGGTYDFYATNPANGALPVLSNSSGEFVTASLDADTTLWNGFRGGDLASGGITPGISRPVDW